MYSFGIEGSKKGAVGGFITENIETKPADKHVAVYAIFLKKPDFDKLKNNIEDFIENVGKTTGSVFEVPTDSTLTLTNCTGDGRIKCENGSGVYVNGGTLNLYSGQITKSQGQTGDKSNKYGGGVYVNRGNFNMYGGDITGNSANYGGGVSCCR